ncbi:MAG: hypothetical protein HY340_01040 [Candidatus Kerfeldbacteria bacterium]|nr:hypothetical protein [Candidatus Kerfeldbacteria bacterium]
MTLTQNDIQAIAKLLQTEVPVLVEKATESSFIAIRKDLGEIATSMDEFLHIIRRHEEEWLVLREQHKRIREVLLKKGIATEDELAVA